MILKPEPRKEETPALTKSPPQDVCSEGIQTGCKAKRKYVKKVKTDLPLGHHDPKHKVGNSELMYCMGSFGTLQLIQKRKRTTFTSEDMLEIVLDLAKTLQG